MDPFRAFAESGVWAIVALAWGCLPDPPQYDACAGTDSEYYVVAPKGCNGHELVTLFALETEHSELLTAALIQRTASLSLLHSTLQLDREFLYWMAPGHTVLRTHTRERTHVELYRASGLTSAVIGMSTDRRQLYVAELDLLTAPDGSERVTSRIVALDLRSPAIGTEPLESVPGVLPSHARVVADLADMKLTRIVTVGDRFYFTSDYASSIRSGRLSDSAVTRTSDLEVVVSAKVTDFRLTDPGELNYVAYEEPPLGAAPGAHALKRLHLDSSTTEVLLSLDGSDNYARLSAENGDLYLFGCHSWFGVCRWYRIDGERVAVADELSMQGLDTPMAVDARGVFVVGSPRDGAALPRLLDFSGTVTAPSVLAAPVVTTVPLQLDDEFIYVQSNYSYATTNASGSSTMVDATRLLRVRR